MKLRRYLAFFLAFVLTFPLFGCSQSVPEDMVAVYLQTVKTTQYSDYTIRLLREYDEKGNLVAEATYRDGTEIERYEWEYDSQNQRTTAIYYQKNLEPEYLDYVYEYDDSGRNISYIINSVRSNGIEYELESLKTEYDDLGNIIKETHYSSKSDIIPGIVVRTYDYDSAGRMIEKTVNSSRYVYEYTDESTVEIVTYDEEGREKTRTRQEYDRDGKLLAYTSSNYGKVSVSRNYTYEYDEKDRLIKQIGYRNGSHDFTYTYEYNENGLLSSESRENDSGVTVIDYKYVRLLMTPEDALEYKAAHADQNIHIEE